MGRYTWALCIGMLAVICGAFFDNSLLSLLASERFSNAFAGWQTTGCNLVHAVYSWLAAHPYPAVIGGMVLYLLVLMAFSHYTSRSRDRVRLETLRQQYQAYQAFQHYRRLRQWQQQHPEQQQQQQQQEQQRDSNLDLKWGGMMGFGPQPLPDGCHGAVKEVLEAMDFYEVLGVAWNDSNPKALKSARKSRALAVHPDKAGGGAGADLAASRVNAAFDTLNCARARAEYDAWLANQF